MHTGGEALQAGGAAVFVFDTQLQPCPPTSPRHTAVPPLSKITNILDLQASTLASIN